MNKYALHQLLESIIARTRTTPAETEEGLEHDDIAISPIGIPIVTGPGAITAVMVLAGETDGAQEQILQGGRAALHAPPWLPVRAVRRVRGAPLWRRARLQEAGLRHTAHGTLAASANAGGGVRRW